MKVSFVLALCLCAISGCRRKETAAAANTAAPPPEQAAQIESQYLLPTNNAAPARSTPRFRNPGAQPTAKPIQERLQGAIQAQHTV